MHIYYLHTLKIFCRSKEILQERELRKRNEQLESKVVTIFYAEGRANTEELARYIGACLEYEGLSIVNLADIETTAFMKYRVSYICVIYRISPEIMHSFQDEVFI